MKCPICGSENIKDFICQDCDENLSDYTENECKECGASMAITEADEKDIYKCPSCGFTVEVPWGSTYADEPLLSDGAGASEDYEDEDEDYLCEDEDEDEDDDFDEDDLYEDEDDDV